MNMKVNSLKILSAVVTGLFVLGTTMYAQRDAVDTRTSHPVMTGEAITKADAEKKYPATERTLSTGEPKSALSFGSRIEPISAISTV